MQTLNLLKNQLTDLKLHGINGSLDARLEAARKEGSALEDVMALLLQDEIDYKKSKKIQRLLKNAHFKEQASIEGFETPKARGVEKSLLNDLSTGSFLRHGQNIIISGPTGAGKSYLAQGIGHSICRQGLAGVFYRLNKLLEEIVLHRAQNQYLILLKRLSNPHLLILDDFGIRPLQAHEFQDFYDLIDERGENKSIILTTQVPPENWNEVIPDPVICEAITDRLVSNAVQFQLKLEKDSFRAKKRDRRPLKN